MSRLDESSMWQLLLYRIRYYAREPAALVWNFVFPLVTTLVLALAFREQQVTQVSVAVATGPESPALIAVLAADPRLKVAEVPRAEALGLLQQGGHAAVVIPGPVPEIHIEPTQDRGQLARVLVKNALAKAAGLATEVPAREVEVVVPGTRYVDFLIPGMLGYTLMSAGILGLGFPIVESRRAKLLKRLVASPMKRGQFLLSFMAGASVFAVVIVVYHLLLAHLLFRVPIEGSIAEIVALGAWGGLCFGGLGVLVVSRARSSEVAQGVMQLITMSMMVLSGVFFPSSNFPGWMQPLISALPLTALNDALRAMMLQGQSLAAVAPQLGIISGWGVASFAVAVRIFRWQ